MVETLSIHHFTTAADMYSRAKLPYFAGPLYAVIGKKQEAAREANSLISLKEHAAAATIKALAGDKLGAFEAARKIGAPKSRLATLAIVATLCDDKPNAAKFAVQLEKRHGLIVDAGIVHAVIGDVPSALRNAVQLEKQGKLVDAGLVYAFAGHKRKALQISLELAKHGDSLAGAARIRIIAGYPAEALAIVNHISKAGAHHTAGLLFARAHDTRGVQHSMNKLIAAGMLDEANQIGTYELLRDLVYLGKLNEKKFHLLG
ncbi:MAG: hypothetical protein V1722_03080 [Candidatus Micrarchaeota archaeon]